MMTLAQLNLTVTVITVAFVVLTAIIVISNETENWFKKKREEMRRELN